NRIQFYEQVEWISNGVKALESIQTAKVDPTLIILDLNLPGINGHTILQYLKSDLQKRKIPVIIFSSSTQKKDIELAYQNHANSYIRKPDSLKEYFDFATNIRNYWFNLVCLTQ